MHDLRPLRIIAAALFGLHLLGLPATALGADGRQATTQGADARRTATQGADARHTTTQDIIQALTPRPGHPHLHGIELDLPKPEPQPSVTFHVTFARNSSTLTEDSLQMVDRIGEALSSDALKSSRFLVAGYTDAAGTPEHNMALSLNRAKSVADRLTTKFGIPPSRLQVQGYGADRLLDPDHPLSDINRRVQIVNLGPMP